MVLVNETPKVTAYVVGGAGLLGRAIVSAFHDANVKVHTLEPKSFIDKKLGLGDIPDHIHAFDATNTANFDSALDQMECENGLADIWVNCAYPRTEKFATSIEGHLDAKDWSENTTLQMDSVCLLSSTVAQRMARRGGGSIINITSIYGMVGPDFSLYDGTNLGMPPAYSAIKAGIINYSKYLASFHAKSGVRVNCVSPGGVANKQPERFVRNYGDRVPIGRLATAEEIAGPVVFLASGAASYITGVNLPVDGGWTAI
jgi:NAD(P)-dependent dehydrogenase (short-subunit alcohol dehydrogenase family)